MAIFNGTAGNDIINLSSGVTANLINGLAGNDTLTGGSGDDTLDGGEGIDSLVGGTGNDTYYVSSVYFDDEGYSIFDKVTEDSLSGSGIDTVIVSGEGYILPKNVENLVSTTGGVARGNGLNNVITGSASADVIYALAGNDTVLAGGGNDIIYGAEGADSIDAGAGNDTLEGGADIDSLTGGSGNDTYYVTGVYNDDLGYSIFDKVLEDSVAGSGTDTVITGADGYTLAKNVENLVWTAGGVAHGNVLNNLITASNSADIIEGLAGNDTVLAGGGNDLIAAGHGDDSVEGGDGNDTIWGDSNLLGSAGLTGNDFLRGGAGHDYIEGGLGADTLYGDAGNDTLNGSDGHDSMVGGDGNDTYYVASYSAGDGEDRPLTENRVIETNSINSGIDTVIFVGGGGVGYNLTSNVENFIALVQGFIRGNALNNLMKGSINDLNTFVGAGGEDTMLGGALEDWYAGGEGADLIDTGDGDDRLWGDGGLGMAVIGVGNDTLLGGKGNDILEGGEGNDSLVGGADTDTLIDDSTSSDDIYVWGRAQGADNLTDSGGTDRLDILAGVTANQLWFRHLGSNLEISVIGTSDSFTINNWYGSAANQVETVKLSDGKTLTADKVDNLVNAMAAFTPPAAGQTTLAANYQTALNPVIAANWA